MMAKLNTLLGFIGLLGTVKGEPNKYDNYTLLMITPYKEQHLEALATLPELPTDPAGELDVLRWSRGLNDSTDVLVSPSNKATLEDFARRHGMLVEFKYNYGRFFNDTVEKDISRSGSFLSDYHSYKEIEDFLRMKVGGSSSLVQMQEIGESYEKRKLLLVKISTNHGADNPIIFIEGGAHAREWVSPAMILYIVQRLTTDHDAQSRELNGVDWYIIPVTNPDGYEYTRASVQNRMWRKTRSKVPNHKCVGVDLNRNFGYKWGVAGVSTDPCSNIYPGPSAFSEVEARVVRDVTARLKRRIKLYVAVHTYGNYLIYPWGHTKTGKTETWKKLSNLAKMASDEVQKAGGPPLRVMSGAQWYPLSGISQDYAYGVTGVPYSYTLELTRGFEFIFPASILDIILPQYYEAFRSMATQIRVEFAGKPKI